MSAQSVEEISPRIRQALDELQTMIRRRYPDATFRVARGMDDPQAIHLVTTVDVDDQDAVLDLVVDRMMELQIAEGLPMFVIPVRPAARVLAMRTGLPAAGPPSGAE
jgi:hypothetical protein